MGKRVRENEYGNLLAVALPTDIVIHNGEGTKFL